MDENGRDAGSGERHEDTGDEIRAENDADPVHDERIEREEDRCLGGVVAMLRDAEEPPGVPLLEGPEEKVGPRVVGAKRREVVAERRPEEGERAPEEERGANDDEPPKGLPAS
jgi:hypothetical protein